MSPLLLFPDTCLLINLAYVKRISLLRADFEDKANWTLEVAREVDASKSFVVGLREMVAFMPEPIVPTPAERVDTQLIRTQFLNPGDTEPTKHLGEAETFAVIERRFADRSVIVATEDRDVGRYGRVREIKIINTRALFAMWVKRGLLQPEEANQELQALRDIYDRPVSGFPPLL